MSLAELSASDADANQEDAFRVETTETGDTLQVAFHGDLTLSEAAKLWGSVLHVLDSSRGFKRVSLDLTNTKRMDGAGSAFLIHLQKQLKRANINCNVVGENPRVRPILALYQRLRSVSRRPGKAPTTTARIGDFVSELSSGFFWLLQFTGSLVCALPRALRSPRRANMRGVWLVMERAGADAVPIIVLINFLIGFVMAYQSASQLRRFGAELLVANLIGFSVTRELAPLMTAIISSGRSGASFAAEIGTMKVSEEIDALKTLGISPVAYLVIPRLLGVLVVMPLLVIIGDISGIAGGMVLAKIKLDVSPMMYLSQLRSALAVHDVLSGLVKSVLFGFAVVFVACQRGLSTDGGAEGVGRSTTGAVVSIIFTLILLDAAFTVILGGLSL